MKDKNPVKSTIDQFWSKITLILTFESRIHDLEAQVSQNKKEIDQLRTWIAPKANVHYSGGFITETMKNGRKLRDVYPHNR